MASNQNDTEEFAFCVDGLGWFLGCFKHFFGTEEPLFCVHPYTCVDEWVL